MTRADRVHDVGSDTVDATASGAAVEAARLHALAGAPRPAGLPPRAERALGVAAEVGAPPVEALDAVLAAIADERRRVRSVSVATAQAHAVALGLVAVPLAAAPALSWLVGIDLLGFYRGPSGRLTLLAAASLLAVGFWWMRRAIQRVGNPVRERTGPPTWLAALALAVAAAWRPVAALAVLVVLAVRLRRQVHVGALDRLDEIADLTATALRGGIAAPAALRLVGARLEGLEPALRRLAFALEVGAEVDPPPGLDRLASLLETARLHGAPVHDALRRLAADVRAERLARALADAERLPVRLAFPTVLCLLPAGALLVGAPLLVGGLTTSGLTT